MLFLPYQLGPTLLRNRVVMAPMTRNRADANHVPTPMMAEYYRQRASMGLLITEGVAPAPNGAGYARMPGLYNAQQAAAWRIVTDAVHAREGRIFMQMMHTGRASHLANMPAGAIVVGPTATPMPGEIWTDSKGNQSPSTPCALTEPQIQATIAEFVYSATLALEAGFDGVELHGANGYLLEQFLNANVNTRADGWGGTVETRNRFVLDIARAVSTAIGADRVGIRLSPLGAFNATGTFAGDEVQYLALAQSLGAMQLAYLHLVDHSSMGAPVVPLELKAGLQQAFGGTFISSGGINRTQAEQLLTGHKADLVAFGRAALANPDLAERLADNQRLNAPDMATFYTPGEKGYTDYPALQVTVG